MNSWINLDAVWKIVVVGLALGAGLPALFAVGVRALAIGSTTPAGDGAQSGTAAAGGNLTGRIIAGVCFAVVLAGIAWGVYKIVHPN